MDIKFLKEKLKLRKKKKKKNDRILKIFTVIFIMGYVFFFSSNLFFPKIYKNIELTYPGQEIDLDSYILTLEAWDYSKEDNKFEIIFAIVNLTAEKKPRIKYNIKVDNKIFRTGVHKAGENKYSVKAYKLPGKWTNASLTIAGKDRTVIINTNDKFVNKVEKIKKRSNKEYEIYSLESKISGMKKYIQKLKKETKEYEKQMLTSYDNMGVLQAREKEAKTDREKEKISESISKLSAEYEQIKAESDEAMDMINEYENKIKNEENKLKTLKGEKRKG